MYENEDTGWAGAVVNGFHRDTNGILDLDFPCFSYGRYAQDQGPRGKVIDYRVPIDMEGVKINPETLCLGTWTVSLLSLRRLRRK